MLRRCSMFMILGVVGLSLVPAYAADPSERELELLAAEFERMFEPLFGAFETEPVFTKHAGGVASLHWPLAEEQLRDLRAQGTAAKPLRTLAGGHMASEPSNLATMINAILANLTSSYNFWWGYLNQAEDDGEGTGDAQLPGRRDGVATGGKDKVVGRRRGAGVERARQGRHGGGEDGAEEHTEQADRHLIEDEAGEDPVQPLEGNGRR